MTNTSATSLCSEEMQRRRVRESIASGASQAGGGTGGLGAVPCASTEGGGVVPGAIGSGASWSAAAAGKDATALVAQAIGQVAMPRCTTSCTSAASATCAPAHPSGAAHASRGWLGPAKSTCSPSRPLATGCSSEASRRGLPDDVRVCACTSSGLGGRASLLDVTSMRLCGAGASGGADAWSARRQLQASQPRLCAPGLPNRHSAPPGRLWRGRATRRRHLLHSGLHCLAVSMAA